jgi:hypothetical protein
MKPSEAKKYATKSKDCWKKDCFVPFSGNGKKICRLFELGKCLPETNSLHQSPKG